MNRLSRQLKMSKSASATLVQAQDEPALLQAMCDVVTDCGGYGAAWVSFCKAGAGGASHPVVWSGIDAATFQRCSSTSASLSSGDSRVGSITPAGQPYILPLAAHHPNLEPWRQEALNLGYGMAASFPLTCRGFLLGTLTILAADTVKFDAVEIDLLGQIADGLSYGLAALRDRRAAAESAVHLRHGIDATVAAIVAMLDEHEPFTVDHQRRTAEIAVAIARETGVAEADLHGIRLASLIHDVGKIAIPAEILNRPGKLTAAQFELVKLHVRAGFDIVKGIAFPWPVAQTILQHHERVDGAGYPNGLHHDEILPDARIVVVADAVDAITSSRPYRPPHSVDTAITELENGRDRHFDADVADACVRVLRNGAFDFEAKAH